MLEGSLKDNLINLWKTIKSLLKIVISIYILWGMLLVFGQKYLLFHPSKNIQSTPRDINLDYNNINFRSADGTRIHGWFVPAMKAKYTLLFCHGNAGNISHRLESIEIFHSLNLNVFIFDYRGYGNSDGAPDENGIYMDVQAAYNFLLNQKKVLEKKIIVFGRSMGGAICANILLKNSPAALILESTFTSIIDIAKDKYPIYPIEQIARYKFDTLSKIKNYGGNVLIIHSKDDTLVPYSHGLALAKASGTNILAIQGSHNFGHLNSLVFYKAGLKKFITEMDLKTYK